MTDTPPIILPINNLSATTSTALGPAGLRVTTEDNVSHVRLPPMYAVAGLPDRWQGRPWQPDEISGIDPEYTWGFPTPYTHTFRTGEGHSHYNTVPLDRSNRAGHDDGAFIIPNVGDGHANNDADHGGHIMVALDNQWAISFWIEDVVDPDPQVYGYLHAALMERTPQDTLQLRHEITIAPSPSGYSALEEFDCRAMAERLTANRAIVAAHRNSSQDDPNNITGTPWVYIIERTGSQISVALEHHVDAAHEAVWNDYEYMHERAMVWGLAVLNPTKFVISWMGTKNTGYGLSPGPPVEDQPRIAVCEISGTTITEQAGFFLPKIGLTQRNSYDIGYEVPVSADDFVGVGLCVLNETTVAYQILLNVQDTNETVGSEQNFVRFGGWHLGRLHINGLDYTADYPALVDAWWRRSVHPGNGSVSWERSGSSDNRIPPDTYRISDTEVICAYDRDGGVAPYHVTHDNGDVETFPPHTGGYPITFWSTTYGGTAPNYGSTIHARQYSSIVPCVRRCRFESAAGVDTVLFKYPQHFLDITFPAWHLPDNLGRTNRVQAAWGLTSCKIRPIREGQFVGMWHKFSYLFDDGDTYYTPSTPITNDLQSPASAASPTYRLLRHENIKQIYGYPPGSSLNGMFWTLLEVDDTSPSGLHSDGASDSQFLNYLDSFSNNNMPYAFPDGVMCLSGNIQNQGGYAPEWPGYYQYINEILAYTLDLNGGDHIPVMIPNMTGKTHFGDPDQYNFSGGHNYLETEVPKFGPIYEEYYLQSWDYYYYEPQWFAKYGLVPPGGNYEPQTNEEYALYSDWYYRLPTFDRTVNMWVVKVGHRGTPVPGTKNLRVKKEGEKRQ